MQNLAKKLSQKLIHWIVFSTELFFLVGLFSCGMYSAESNPLLSLPHLKLHSWLKRVKECPGFDSSLHLRRGQEWLSSALRSEAKGKPYCCPQLLHTCEKQHRLCLSLLPGRGKSQAPESLNVTEEKGGAAGEDTSHRYGVGRLAAARYWGNMARKSWE